MRVSFRAGDDRSRHGSRGASLRALTPRVNRSTGSDFGRAANHSGSSTRGGSGASGHGEPPAGYRLSCWPAEGSIPAPHPAVLKRSGPLHTGGPLMNRPFAIALALLTTWFSLLAAPSSVAAKPEGTLTVAVATFGNERWLPHLYVGAEDVVLKPMYENLLTRDPKTGELAPMLAERWQVLDGGRTWRFHIRKGVRFHNGAELTAEDVRFTFASLAKEGSANSLAPEFRAIKSMEVENPHTLTVHFDKPFVVFGNKVNQGLFASCAFIQSKRHIEAAGEQGAERQPIGTGPWKFVEHVRGDRIVYEAKVPWAQPDAERARKVRLALNLAVDKQAIMQRVLGGLGTVLGSWLAYPADPWASETLKKPFPYEPAKAKQLLAEAGYPNGFEVTMNLTAWPGRGYLPDVRETVATYWERVGIKVKRRPVDRAVFSADFRARAYSGVTLAYASPLVAPEPWEVP